MKKCLSMLALGVLFLAVAPAGAEDPPYLDFVKALRARNYSDLALDYLERLKNDPKTPNDIKAILPLERGRTYLERAANEFNVAKRADAYNKGRAEFESFIKAKPTDPYAAEAKYEAARILALQGRSQLSRAQRNREEGAQAAEFQKAHDMFTQSNRELTAALAQIEEQLGKNQAPAVTKALTNDKLACRLEINLTKIDRAACFEALNKNLEERGTMLKDAIADLKKLHSEDTKNPISWIARAYMGKAYLEGDQPKEAETELKAVLSEAGPQVETAQRLARYFTFMDKVDIRKRKASDNEIIIKLGDEWIRLYGGHVNTPEGILLRFELAKTYEAMATVNMKDPKVAPDAKTKDLLDKAEQLYTALDDLGTEYSDEIQQRKMNTMMRKFGNVNVTNTATLVTFDQAYSAMQALAIQLAKSEKEDDRKALLRKILDVLNRAVALNDGKVPDAKVAEVKSNMAWVYLSLGDPYKAVILGEHLAHTMPTVPKAAAGGAYALQAYAQMMGDGTADPKWIDVDAERMHRLAVFMEKTFPTDPNTDAARHQVGTMLLGQKKAREAADVLSRVTENYKPPSARAAARWWWAVAAQQMLSEPKLTEKEKQAYQDQVFKALESFPEVDNNAPADVAQMYVQSKLQLGQNFYETKKFDRMEGLAKTLQTRLPNFKNLDANYKKDMKRTVDALVYYSEFGRANAELHNGKYAEARKLADPVLQLVTAQVSTMKKDLAAARDALGLAEAKVKAGDNKAQGEADDLKERVERLARNVARDEQLQRGLMVVALRAAIMDPAGGARAQQLLAGLQAMAAAAKDNAEAGNVSQSIYVQIVAEMHKQITDLKAQGPAAKATLDLTVKSFTSFLDQLASKPLTPELIFFLANAYQSLEKWTEAGQLLGKIPAPGANATEKEQNLYKAAQLMQLINLRKGKQYKEAETLLSKVMKTEWGGKSMQVADERAHLMEDQSKWGGAAVAWKDLMGMLLPSITKGNAPPKVKETYYEAYFNYIYCLNKYAAGQDDAKKKADYVKRAAQAIIKLEETQPDFGGEAIKPKYQKLLKDEPALKKEYDSGKAANAAANNK